MTPAPPDILIAGAHDFLAPYLYEAAVSYFRGSVWMLGTGRLAGIPVDLSREIPKLPVPMNNVFYADGTDETHLDASAALRAARNLTAALSTHPPMSLVYISSVAVYGVNVGENLPESTPLNPATSFGRAKLEVERYFGEWCRANGVVLTVLRVAPVVGTGMGGSLRETVNRIYRATYRHIAADEARVSVVHAVDVAAAAMLISGHAGVFNVTDGIDPTRHDLAEALSARLDHKRVYTFPLRKLKILARVGDFLPVTGYNTPRLREQMSTLTFDSTQLRTAIPAFVPHSVTRYLTTHVYDSSSL